MYHLEYTSGRHTFLDNLPKSCPKGCQPYIDVAISELFKEIPSQTGYDYANFYRREFNIEEEEYGKPYQPKKVKPLSDAELHALKLRKKR